MKEFLKIKVCGMRDPLNIDELCSAKPDYIGFIFYPPSKRYVKDITDGKALNFIPKQIKKTGVFVDATLSEIEEAVKEYKLSAIQLHGFETPEFCLKIKNMGLEVIKAFHINDEFNFSPLEEYENVCDYFLFDTKTVGFGGSGKKFSWDILHQYKLNKSFFLSGGITIDDIENIKKIEHPAFYAVDINSKFEDSPGIKNIQQIRGFIQNLLS